LNLFCQAFIAKIRFELFEIRDYLLTTIAALSATIY